MTLGQKIKEQRKFLEKTQKELAIIAGISNSYLSDIESDRTRPSLKTLLNLSKALNIDLDILVSNSETINLRKKREMSFKKQKQRFDLLHHVFHNITEGIIITDNLGTILDCNAIFCKKLGYTRKSLINTKATPLVHPNNLWKVRDLNSSDKYQKIHIIEELMNQKTKEAIKYLVTIQKIQKKEEIFFLCSINTIHSTKELVNSLNIQPSEWYQHLLQHSPNAILILDLKMTIIELNLPATEFFEQLRVDLIGKNFRDLCYFDPKKDNAPNKSSADYFYQLKNGQCVNAILQKQITETSFKKASVTMYPIHINGKHAGYCLSYAQID